jgi:hypothetical protein
MAVREVDYLVVGAGATGMAFTDALVAESDAEILMVDRRHRPGGHWHDDYSFVRLHQPSAVYGVVSRRLGQDHIDDTGPNAGFYERATAAELCDYYGRVLDEDLVPTGRVEFLGTHDHVGAQGDEHHLRSRLTGATTTVRVRRKVVDATYLESSLPSTHVPPFAVDPDARVVSPNDLVNLSQPGSGFTVIGAGKTAMDTCVWLVDNGVAPDAVRWIRPRDAWTNDRSVMQPLQLVAGFTRWMADHNEAAAEATDLHDLFRRLEDRGAVLRIDPRVEPSFHRGAILSEGERATLRGIEDVIRLGRVVGVGTRHIELEGGTVATAPGHVHVDCTAAGLGAKPIRPIFEDGRITVQWVQFGLAPFNAALIGHVEATREDDRQKNHLCPANGFTPAADARNYARSWATTQRAVGAWMAEPDLTEWLGRCRLNMLGGAGEHLRAPAAMKPFIRSLELQEQAIKNLDRIAATPETVPV